MSNEQLHERHPGRGMPTSLIAATDPDDRSVGGFYIFLPSGATKTVAWRQEKPITPTKEAAQDFTTKLVEDMMKSGLDSDIARTNWASVVAAVQRIILDWNEGAKNLVGERMAREFRKANGLH